MEIMMSAVVALVEPVYRPRASRCIVRCCDTPASFETP
jgi:hypothetical protein